jgi:endonuclease YncB( thermonuclease family)
LEGIMMAAKTPKISAFIIAIVAFPAIVFSAQYKCTRVTDGDTITVVTSDQKSTIRLVGIDAPETSHNKHQPGQPFSQNSTKFLAGMVLNKNVDIVSYGNDR